MADAERDIQSGGDASRQAAFAGKDATAFGAECGAGGAGLRARAVAGQAPVWQSVDLSGKEDAGACTVAHGAYTGAALPTGEGFLSFKKPRYVIERMACHEPGDDATTPHYCYRVTAIGFGARPETEVVLQSVFNRPE